MTQADRSPSPRPSDSGGSIPQPQALEVSISYVETVNLVFTTKKMPMSLQIRRPF
jgi:hypothetical protein